VSTYFKRTLKSAIRTQSQISGADKRWLVTLGGHSLRAGFVTEAARRGETAFRIMATTPHRSIESLKGYIRPAADGERGAIGLL